MPEELETLLRLVRDGHLSPEEAAPIIEALTRAERPSDHDPMDDGDDTSGLDDRIQRRVERQVRRAGRQVERASARAARAIGRAEAHIGGRQVRIRVTERGRQVVNLRIPLPFAHAALRAVPGLGADQASRIREAIDAGTTGPIVDVEDSDGSGVLITVE